MRKTAPAPAAGAFAATAARGWRMRLAALFFEPDVIAAPDPLAPDPRVVADGFAAAFRQCADTGRTRRLLVARAPGTVFRIALDPSKRECTVERVAAASGACVPPDAPLDRLCSLPARAASRLPPFSTGAEPSVLLLSGDGDDIRLVLRCGTPRDARVRAHFPGAARLCARR